MLDNEMKIRRAVVRTTIEPRVTLSIPGTDADTLAYLASRYAKSKRIGMKIEFAENNVLILTPAEFVSNEKSYPEIDRLKVGESHLYELAPPDHQRVRQAASNRNRMSMALYACTREGDFIRVTRLPLTDEEKARCEPVIHTERTTKYDLERLSTGQKLRFELPRAEHHRLRLACSKKAAVTGWTIRCRVQDDGSLLVYRTDSGVPVIELPPAQPRPTPAG